MRHDTRHGKEVREDSSSFGRSLAAAGLRQLRASSVCARTDTELSLLALLLPFCGRGSVTEQRWEHGSLCCDFSRHATDLNALEDHQALTFGKFSLGALLSAPLFGADILRLEPMRRLRWCDLPEGATIGHIVDIHRRSSTCLIFRCKTIDYPLPPRAARSFRLLCDALVMNYPAIRRVHDPPDVLQPKPRSADVWRARQTDEGVRLVREFSMAAHEDLGVVASLGDAAKRARAAGHAILRFNQHPIFTRCPPLWEKDSSQHGDASTSAVRSAAARKVSARSECARLFDADIGDALNTVSWTRVARLRYATSRLRLLYYRIKALRISGWDRSSNGCACPHCPNVGVDGGHTFHIFWHCAAAQSLWNTVRHFWQTLVLWTTDTTFRHAIFALQLPATPPLAS